MILLLRASKFVTAKIECIFETGNKNIWGVPFILILMVHAKLKRFPQSSKFQAHSTKFNYYSITLLIQFATLILFSLFTYFMYSLNCACVWGLILKCSIVYWSLCCFFYCSNIVFINRALYMCLHRCSSNITFSMGKVRILGLLLPFPKSLCDR